MATLLQQGPAQTSGYMIAGFSIIIGLIGVYVMSLFLRLRKIDRAIGILRESLKDEASDLR